MIKMTQVVTPAPEQISAAFKNFKGVIDSNHPNSIVPGMKALSIHGNALQGHVHFRGTKYPNTTLYDILMGIHDGDENKIETFRRGISQHIDQTKQILDAALELIEGKKNSHLIKVNPQGEYLSLEHYDTQGPLFGLNIFNSKRFIINDPLMFLRGAYIAAMMDSAHMRKKTIEMFPETFDGSKLIIGRGTCHIGNIKNIHKEKLTLEELANSEFQKEGGGISDLKKKGIIRIGKTYREFDAPQYNPHEFSTYIREKIGPGCCDDSTLIAIAMLHKKYRRRSAIDAFHGGVLMDTIDTIDKIGAMPVTGGMDEFLGHYIHTRYKQITGEDIVSQKEVCTAIYLGAVGNTPNLYHSSSVRRFNQFERLKNGRTITALQAHINFIKHGTITHNLKLGFNRVDSTEFYNTINQRLELAKKRDML